MIDTRLDRLSPNRDKRRNTFLLRGLLVVAVGALFLDRGREVAGTGALALLVVFAAAESLLLFVPLRLVRHRAFELTLGGLDVLLVGLGIHLAGGASGARSRKMSLPASFKPSQ